MSKHTLFDDEAAALRKILEGTASHTGNEFFRALVRNLAEALKTKGAWVTEYLPEKRRLRAIAFWMQDRFVDQYEYNVKGTPCERVIEKQSLFHVAENIIELFPGDPDLKPFDAVSYLGAPLLDLDGAVLGHLAVQDNRPLPEEARKVDLFRIFAERAASELRRIRAQSRLQEREEQLRRLFDSAMDAIIEIDENFTITQANSAAVALFGENRQDNICGLKFSQYLSPDSLEKLKQLQDVLKDQSTKERFLWVAGGLNASDKSGNAFQTEATLSCYHHNRKVYFNLVLRNVSERLEAEEKLDRLSAETEYLREELRQSNHFDEIIGESPAILKVLNGIRQVASSNASVLIYGETGTGKELVARSLHRNSGRSERALVKVNCAAIPEALIESEFFGHEKGAFTGATEKRQGRFALADGGSIFLDEIGELSAELQTKLLRVLQEGEFEAVGSSRTQKVDVRVIAATNRNLKQMIADGTFREDLYYRLNVFPVHVPPLRERGNDVLLIATKLIQQFAQQSGQKLQPLSQADIRRMKSYHWPGNIRELRNIIERAVITARNGRLDLSTVFPEPAAPHRPRESAIHAAPDKVLTISEMQELEKQNMIRALEQTRWKVAGENGAARIMGVPSTTFSSRMKALGIRRP